MKNWGESLAWASPLFSFYRYAGNNNFWSFAHRIIFLSAFFAR